ncbi:MAG: Flp family type IVb pilin [Acidobacteriales bacterium]|nr:Flp family type IVb pilin [Terriglobales bacterium]
MTTTLINLMNRLHQDESGQGLVEYLLVIALVAFAATAGMKGLANSLSSAFSQIGTTLGTYIT